MNGPGGHTKRLLAKIGIVPQPDCSCNRHATQMDALGIEWCREHRDSDIRAWMRTEAKRRDLPFNGLAASMLVERAIRNAEHDSWHVHPNIICGMTTAPRKVPTLAASVLSLAAAGYQTAVFAEPDSPQMDELPDWCEVVQRERKYGAWHNWLAMAHELLRRADETGARYIATFQDDIQCTPHLRTMVESFPFDARNGCLLLYTPSHYYHWEKPDHGWRKVTTSALWGVLGVVVEREQFRKTLDAKVTREWLGARPRRRDGESTDEYKARVEALRQKHRKQPQCIGNVDTAFGHACRTAMHCHIPSLIRHTATHSAMGHGGNTGKRQAAALLTELPPEQKRARIPKGTPKPKAGETQPRFSYTDGSRNKLRYYHAVRKMLKGKKGTLLDVGGGVSEGVNWLKALQHLKRTSIELEDMGGRLDGVDVRFGDFMSAEVKPVDYVTCLQVLEHTPDPPAFCQKLFATARKQVIISVPYRWPPDDTGEHSHHGIDEAKLQEWTGRQPTKTALIEEDATKAGKPVRRLVAVYAVSQPGID